jgi:hypothetical protein
MNNWKTKNEERSFSFFHWRINLPTVREYELFWFLFRRLSSNLDNNDYSKRTRQFFGEIFVGSCLVSRNEGILMQKKFDVGQKQVLTIYWFEWFFHLFLKKFSFLSKKCQHSTYGNVSFPSIFSCLMDTYHNNVIYIDMTRLLSFLYKQISLFCLFDWRVVYLAIILTALYCISEKQEIDEYF